MTTSSICDIFPNVTPDMAFNKYVDTNLVNSAGIAAAPFNSNVTMRDSKKQPKYIAEKIVTTVAAGETYTLPEKATLTKANGTTSEADVKWAVDSVTGDKNTTLKLYGLVSGSDVLVPAEITVKGAASSAAKLPFVDVAEGDYYADAVAWAYENNVTKGTSDTTFGPADSCTRGQVVTFLYRSFK